MNLGLAHEEQLHEGSTFPMGDPCCLDGGGICLGRFRFHGDPGKESRFGIWARASGSRRLLPRLRFKKRDFPWGAMTLQERSVLYIMPWICRAI